ncbi:MAG: hypothetical protein CO031_00460 [Candidatus Nealsonbacteria bacterium CG_4_9_14_0_2_um_filter_37_38]|uniref:Tetratricopeptide repeat protein n=1 Tax=Candidatus Nealsonbacteria bacterium CG_4_10_14_0_8_um_filter_37_14 TaxID=1974684 RepID=A0A2M7R6C4_9BACT|nr:MAG: hypothetical protein COV63_02690 [Candidatus Nealsonbacteria bacterium CG11_big_fil_rev_8_21_14_0_20_37_68]PIW92094.1 MAG: hypothetical protein COZ89_01670 [Candidatus Nealsonbacteria bacterium CG_4_8_14_3_um_filter_37_23]PIY88763.1 MAG: hypothetical protein COY73_02975 [Candidatus Nealsonbacteria bacterium CG_4_10_14_0_8_um_filter_37_14]PJC51847.1 MAG: hypothetical protein CO031_00460 [Candidatus Nealsonbacteria bacterium CG_4_9_14_0_2_um_filter_37_38]
MAEVLEKAQKLYNDGKWQEAVTLLNESLSDLTKTEDIAEALRLKGWCFYYIGIKGPEEEKMEALRLSRNMFDVASRETSDAKKKLSIFNGLPLSLWILGDRNEAWRVSDQAVQGFPDEPSVWNTRSILCRWAKNFEESVKVCEKVYETALYRKDYRTAGHGKHNRADALKELGRTEEAKNDYAAAIGLYKDFEKETVQSAKFHIEGVEKKLLNL